MSRRMVIQKTAGAPVATFSWYDGGLTGNASTKTYSASGGSGSGARFTVTRTGPSGSAVITSVTLSVGGDGYKIGDSLTVIESSSPFDTIYITVETIS